VRGAARADPRSDQWALGVVLFELLSGELPFGRGPATALGAAIVADAPASLRDHRADVPPELVAIVARCLEKDPKDRFANVAALAEALAPFGPSDGAPVAERLQRYATPAPARAWKRPRVLGAAALLAVSIVVAVGSLRSRAPAREDRAVASVPLAPSSPAPPLADAEPTRQAEAAPAQVPEVVDAGSAQALAATARPQASVAPAPPVAPRHVTAAAPPPATTVVAPVASAPPPPPPAPPPGDLEERAMSHRR
jgi:serine/threonine-protein kinase